jgi:hypothetical protein
MGVMGRLLTVSRGLEWPLGSRVKITLPGRQGDRSFGVSGCGLTIGRIDTFHIGKGWRSKAEMATWAGGVFCAIMVAGERHPHCVYC